VDESTLRPLKQMLTSYFEGAANSLAADDTEGTKQIELRTYQD